MFRSAITKLFAIGLALGAAVMMAEVERAAQKPNAEGVEPTVIKEMSAADTQLISNKNGDTVLRVINGSAEACVCTIVTPNTAGGNPIEDRKVTVAAGKTKIIGPFDKATYNNAKGFLEVKFDKVTTITMEVTQVAF